MNQEKEERIRKAEVAMAQCDRNTPAGSNLYNYHKDIIATLSPKKNIVLHVAEDSLCESCE